MSDDHTVPQALVTAASRWPEAPSLLSGHRSLDHAQALAAAYDVADAIATRGLGAEDRIGVLVRRDVESVIGLLGVLLSGAAYVPLDAENPDRRLTHMLEQGRVRLLLAPQTSRERAPSLALCTGTPLVVLPAPEGRRGAPRADRLPHSDDLAYVVFTSGSTGRPKGVEVSHRQLWAATAARFDFPDPAVDLLLLPPMFDAFAGGLYWALARGGAVLLPNDQEVRDPGRLGSLVRRFPISHVNGTPALYDLLLDAVAEDPLDTLVYVDVGGEVLPPRLVGRHARLHPAAQLYNCYGPTETTVWATTFPCAAWHAVEQAVPIGTPVRDYSVAVLDGGLSPAEGRPGDLYVGGPGVARGYADDPRTTAERFLPDPDSAVPGARRYRTGDVVRERDEGGRCVIEFHGRHDDLVKVRGHRIELGEVEHLLRQHPEVREAVVTHVSTSRSDQLHAVVVPAGGGLTRAGLQSWLRTRMPDYMVPRVRMAAELPRTPNGKLDRAAVHAEVRVEDLAGYAGSAPHPISSGSGIADLDEAQLDALLEALRSRS